MIFRLFIVALAMLFAAFKPIVAVSDSSAMVHIYCQQIRGDGALLDRVLTLKQTSASDQVSAADLIGPDTVQTSDSAHFDLHFYGRTSIGRHIADVQNEYLAAKASENSEHVGLGDRYVVETVEALAENKTSMYGGFLEMAFTAVGHRIGPNLVVNTNGPYQFVKTLVVGSFADPKRLDGKLSTGNWKTVIEDGDYVCISPIVIGDK